MQLVILQKCMNMEGVFILFGKENITLDCSIQGFKFRQTYSELGVLDLENSWQYYGEWSY